MRVLISLAKEVKNKVVKIKRCLVRSIYFTFHVFDLPLARCTLWHRLLGVENRIQVTPERSRQRVDGVEAVVFHWRRTSLFVGPKFCRKLDHVLVQSVFFS